MRFNSLEDNIAWDPTIYLSHAILSYNNLCRHRIVYITKPVHNFKIYRPDDGIYAETCSLTNVKNKLLRISSMYSCE
jgi:hypothetical protein